MTAEEIYRKAWMRLIRETQEMPREKARWGRIELQKLMLDCLVNPDAPIVREDR